MKQYIRNVNILVIKHRMNNSYTLLLYYKKITKKPIYIFKHKKQICVKITKNSLNIFHHTISSHDSIRIKPQLIYIKNFQKG